MELNGSADPGSGIWSEGIGFDGSSIRGFLKIRESDMLLYNQGFYVVDSIEVVGIPGGMNNRNLRYKPRYMGAYFPVPPHDSHQDIRSQMILKMSETGIPVEFITMKLQPLGIMRSTCSLAPLSEWQIPA